MPTEQQLTDAIYAAAQQAITRLFSEQSDQHFYYLVLVTTGAAHRPFLSAWSHEALAKTSQSANDAADLKWSYADSPFVLYADDMFAPLDDLFIQRPQLTGTVSNVDWHAEYMLRLNAMETALRRLDADGLFGAGQQRETIFINVECAPPDATNTERARRLNPQAALGDWLAESAE